MSNPLTAQYFDSDGRVAFVACATFALGLIVGALIMDWTHERERRSARKPRPARVRPPEPAKRVARHRHTGGMPMKGGQVVMGGNQPRPQVQDRVPGPPPRGQGGMSGGGHPLPVGRIDVRA